MLIITSSKSKTNAFICLIFKTQKESQDKKKANLSLLFISKFKSDTNTLLFNKMECYKEIEKQKIILAWQEIVFVS